MSAADDSALVAGISCKPDVMDGQPCISSTRIPVSCVASFAPQGVDEILRQYPSLIVRQIADALSYHVATALRDDARQPADVDVSALAKRLFEADEPREIAGATYPEAYDFDADGGKVRRYWEAIARAALTTTTEGKGA